jgi:hypothetical protein
MHAVHEGNVNWKIYFRLSSPFPLLCNNFNDRNNKRMGRSLLLSSLVKMPERVMERGKWERDK